ncbi:MAG: cytochrome c biogenesis protein CcdA [Candidatus Egerieousia sp.]|nr:cytochrome c biogenesis protein CcdA [bacterium]MDY5255405.1 cytochrome c biogenesis protein CcdA [Candidatus Egerieousia sp.]
MDAMQETPQIEWRGAVVAQEGNIYHLEFTCSVPAGWHIYDVKEYNNGPISTSVKLEGEAKAIGALTLTSNVKEEYDSAFGMVIGTCEGAVSMLLKVESNAAAPKQIKAIIEWQACREGACSAPEEQEINITLPATAELNSGANTTTTGSIRDAQSGKSLWSTILEAILWGFVALLTPCVFPMVPMTVSFFLKKSGDKTKGRFMAMMYGLSIVALYTIPIAIIILITYFAGGDSGIVFIFNWLATHWIPNLLFFIIFMIFAASFFGAFEIVMPTSLVNKADAKSEKGGLFGVFFMALTLVLVSFSCTGPIVGTILIKSTQGEIWEPIITMLAFSAAFALPFTIFAFVPSLLKNLPKSGGWLNSVKVVLGFLELALGLKFLSVADQIYGWGILDREVYLALWIVIFTLLGFYLLGKIRFANDSPAGHLTVTRLILSIIVFSFVVYMIPGMWGAPLKAISGYLPPIESQDFVISSNSVATDGAAKSSTISNSNKVYNFKEALRLSEQSGKPIFLDFTGKACVNCREMEARVLSNSRVQQILSENYIVLELYGDTRNPLPESEWVKTSGGTLLKTDGKVNSNLLLERYGVNAMPYYLLLDSKGNPLTAPRGYNLNVEEFVAYLQQ